jgi:alkylation response protein AidB-like acyl-CoA dehydrogenase
MPGDGSHQYPALAGARDEAERLLAASTFDVHGGTEWLDLGPDEARARIPVLGIRASHTAEVILEDCRVPVDNLLGAWIGSKRSSNGPGQASPRAEVRVLSRPSSSAGRAWVLRPSVSPKRPMTGP